MAHGCLPLRTLWLCVPPRPPSPGGPVLFSAVLPSGALSHSPLAPYPGSPPRPLLTARPPPSWGGAGPAVPLPVLLRWACGGSSGLLSVCGLSCCPFRLWLFSGAVPRGCSTLLILPLPSPWLTPRAGSILLCSCTCLLRVWLPAGGPVCQSVAMCVFANHPCFAAHRPSLFRRCATGGSPSPSSWVRMSAGLLLSQLGARWCVFRGSFPSGFLSASWFLVVVAFHVCPGLPTVALWVFWPVLLRFYVGRSSSPPQCVSHPLLSVLHLARCLSPGAPPRR